MQNQEDQPSGTIKSQDFNSNEKKSWGYTNWQRHDKANISVCITQELSKESDKKIHH